MTDRLPTKWSRRRMRTHTRVHWNSAKCDGRRTWRKTQTRWTGKVVEKQRKSDLHTHTHTPIIWAIKKDAKIIQWIRFGSIEWTEQMPILWDVNNDVEWGGGLRAWNTLFLHHPLMRWESRIKKAFTLKSHSERPPLVLRFCSGSIVACAAVRYSSFAPTMCLVVVWLFLCRTFSHDAI